MSRPPLDLTGRKSSASDFEVARQLVRRSGVINRLSSHIDAPVGRKRRLSLEAFLVAFQLNALGRRHEAHLVDVARILNGLDDEQRRKLGISSWDPDEAYDRVEFLFGKLIRALSAGIEGIDAGWFANSFVCASIPSRYRMSRSVAVDGTDIETWGAFQGSVSTLELDGEAAETQLTDGDEQPTRVRKRARVLGLGPDGRKIYTPDPDARAGHRSSNGQHRSGPYIGYELHLAVQTRDVRWTNYVDKTTLGPEVPNLVIRAVLVPAGTHRAKSIVPSLIAEKKEGGDLENVVWDPGYSLCSPETTTFPLTRAGISQTFQLTTAQRGIRPFSPEALVLDGQLYSRFIPKDLRDLAMPPMMAPEPYRAAYERAFNRRARYRLVRHSRPDSDGVTRWRCPFHAGLLRSRNFPSTMRRSKSIPLVTLPPNERCCCQGIISAPPADLPLSQQIPFGTTAWRISMNRRMAAESLNAAIKGGFINLARGFFRLFTTVKLTFLLGFSLAAVNLDRIRSFDAKKAEEEAAPRRRRKRRVGTWHELLGELSEPALDSTGPSG